MRIETEARIINLMSYFKKDKITGEKTEDVGYIMNIALDFDCDNSLKNTVLSPLCSKEFEIAGNINDYEFGDYVVVDLDVPIMGAGEMVKIPPVIYGLRKE